MIELVYKSKIERAYRFLAVTLAFYADENGENVYPGAARLATHLGLSEMRVRHGLLALVRRRVIQEDGFHGHTRRFRFDLEQLARYDPAQARRGDTGDAVGVTPVTREAQPCCRQQGYTGESGVETLLPAATNPAAGDRQPCYPQPRTLLPAAGTDLQDLQDLQDLTGADAPDDADEVRDDGTERSAAVPFQVYAAIAVQAIDASQRGDHSSEYANYSEWFKRLCAQQQLPYDSDIGRRAIDAALTSRDRARTEFQAKLTAYRPKTMTHRTGTS
jgi:hypothetical protein